MLVDLLFTVISDFECSKIHTISIQDVRGISINSIEFLNLNRIEKSSQITVGRFVS